MGKQILAVIAGVVVGVLTIFAIESINMVRFPWPEGLSMEDTEAFNAYVASLPIDALLTVILAYALGSFVAGFVSAKVATSKHMVIGIICGALLTVAGIMNIMAIPHPMWFNIVSLIVFIPMAIFGVKMALNE
ncbi:MAG: hypothetical protein HWD86_06345 [Kangiellaceae bacterium]|nr:hypothetical protein [Kangiellaceae bacterium]